SDCQYFISGCLGVANLGTTAGFAVFRLGRGLFDRAAHRKHNGAKW
ncbi:MAG: hypothetical protein RLY97_1601, partial [Pseudomonadota bacterium]